MVNLVNLLSSLFLQRGNRVRFHRLSQVHHQDPICSHAPEFKPNITFSDISNLIHLSDNYWNVTTTYLQHWTFFRNPFKFLDVSLQTQFQ